MRALLALLVLAGAGCSLGDQRASAPPVEDYFPSWIDETYEDARLTLRYPSDWSRSKSDRFGELLNDNTERTAAFIGVQYLPRREHRSHAEFADVAAAILRPPRGKGTTLEYTQAARIGDRLRRARGAHLRRREQDGSRGRVRLDPTLDHLEVAAPRPSAPGTRAAV